MTDPRFLTGPCMLIMGGLLLWIAYRLWMVDPINRVFRLGPYVTEEGIKAVINMRLLFLAWGGFLTLQGLSSVLFWFVAERDVYSPLVTYVGSLASGFGVFAAVMSGVSMYKLWLER